MCMIFSGGNHMKRFRSILCMACVCLFLLSASIGLPIYIRPF